ncbi:hypothetical protein ES332_A05G411400v1 [Gossypium tomentosum]|uniref:Uncharacterized protein n=1 Tax=Gossypium tomentosum TaxID=34277 RepID=A0A5D2QRG2_GOSTO|nr:hypothetical protein ES332_A05G411400v1 [Gossypium tomentosum]
MAVTIKRAALIVAGLGVLSFILGVIAEIKKPEAGIPIPGKGVVICKYPKDPSLALGYLSVAFLMLSTIAGYWFTSGVAATLLLWPTITEHLHLIRNVHHNPTTTCPTAKTGLLGGGAFVSLDSALFWLVALMLADNARHDHFYDVEKHSKAQVLPDGC